LKGLNVKRIAALAAGAAILGATLASAGAVTYSNTQIISAEGAPQAKIVVGEKAAASDGVAAANIAALIGNLAFKSQDITATVSGTANIGCTVTGGTGAGTCAVSNEKVTLEVTVPGTVGGVYPFNTYINDWVDKKLENRLKGTADDVYNTTLDLSPFATDVGVASTTYAVRKVTSTDFPALQSPTVTDPYANKQYTEYQSLWFQAHAEYSSNPTAKKLAATSPRGAYQIEFVHDQAGVPVGTCDATVLSNLGTDYQDNASYRGDYNLCADQDKTDRHRVHIGFLGDTYIISQMTAPDDCDLETALAECEGGSINLAKESAYGIVHVGENLTAGAYMLKLQDIEAPMYGQTQAAASIAIYDSTGTLLKEDKYYPSTSSYTWTAPDGSKVRIKVYKTNPGYYAYAKWAEMAVYSSEFTLTDATELNADNDNWQVKLIWRNKDPTYASKDADALRKIILYDNFADPSRIMGSGDTYDYVTTPVAYQVEFGGITLGSADYDTLSLAIDYYNTAQFPVQTNFTAPCSATSSIELTNGNLLRVQSLVKDAFQISSDDGDFLANKFYYFMGNETDFGSPAGIAEGDIIFQKAGGNCYFFTTSASVAYLGGDGTVDDSPVWYDDHVEVGDYNTSYINFREAASTSSGITDQWQIPIYRDTDHKDKFQLTSTTTAQITYIGVEGDDYVDADLAIGETTVEPGYYSERGSQFVGISPYGVSINRAKRLGELKFYVKSKGTNTTTGTTVGPLGEGESANVGGGVTIKVDSITETVGTCTAGPNAQCTVTGKEGLTATPSVAKAGVRVALNPSAQKLVVLDKDADKSATLIVVGGNLVNTVAAEVMQTTTINLATDKVVVRAVGTNRILVAGYTGADTLTAADQFIAALIAAAQ